MNQRPHQGQPAIHAGLPLSESRAVVIMLHGRGASPHSILELQPYLNVPRVSYLAPAAAGQTWYPHSFLAPLDQNEPYLTSALTVVGDLVAHVEAQGVPRDRVVLLGFSQGACLASEYAVRHPARYGGLIAFSGGLIGPLGTAWPEQGTFDGMAVFLGCSDMDPHIPLVRVEESAAILARMGAKVAKHIYPGMGHTVNEDEIAHAGELITALAR